MITIAPNPKYRLDFLLKNVSHLLCREFEWRIQQKGLGLTRSQWIILCQVLLLEGCSQRELAESIESDAVTVGRQIKRLGAAGWQVCRYHPRNRRAHQLYLRSQTRDMPVQLERLMAHLREELFTGIPLERREVLIDDLLIIRKNLLACRGRTEGRLAASRMPTSRS